MESLIDSNDTWPLWAIMISGTGLAIWLEQTFRWAARISAPVMALLMAMGLSNLHIMPLQSSAYDFVGTYLVPLAIPLLLFRANALHIARTTGRMFVAFHICALGTFMGALLATLLLRDHIPQIAHAAGIMTGSYTGGGINFFSVKESYDISEQITGPLLVADNFVMAGMFILLLALAGSRFFLARFPHPHLENTDARDAKNRAAEHWQRKEISLLDLARSLAVAFAVVAGAELLGRLMKTCFTPGENAGLLKQMGGTLLTNKYVLITGLSLVTATLFHRPLSRINGPEELGSYLLYLFLFVIGLPADLKSVLFNVPLFFVFCAIIALTNLGVTLALGKLMRQNLEELLLCVNATLGGPPTAVAMAISKGWDKLVLPSLLIGIWGYVIGTPLGVLMAELLLR